MLSEKMFKQPKGLAACEEQAASPLAAVVIPDIQGAPL